MAESVFQSKVRTWLKQKGCYVIVTDGKPAGVPDIIALIPGGGWAALEIKAHKGAKFQPLQKMTIKKLNDMYFSREVYPENWNEIKIELSKII